LGANDGEFPASVKSGGAFADSEREALCALGLPIAFDPLLKASREEFCFLRALCAAKERATVVSFRTDASGTAVYPSLAFLRLEEMFSTASTVTQEEAYSPLAGVEALGEIADAAKEKALLSLLSENADTHRATLGAQTPISDTECEIPADLARTLFGKELRLTQSRLDSYANCPFAYYCRYLLSLSEKTDSSFDFADIGSLIHALLENLFEVLGADGKTIRTVEKEEIPLYAERVCRSYIDAICPREMKDSPRLSHLFARLSRTASLLCEELYDEFSQSKFDPAFFEFAIGKEGAPRPIVFEDGEGGRLSLYGVVDRIDTYRAEDGKLYLRVIDYKTGTKKFSIRDVAKGRNLQMLVYLFSLWKSNDKPFLDSLGLSEGDAPLPAGMLYMSASPKDIKLDAPLSADEVKARAKESLARSGLVLEDESIVRAMDATLSGHYVPLTLSKDGSIKWDDRFASLERMGSLLSQMQDAVLSIGKGMRRGRAHAAPASVRDAGHDVCENCSFRAVCRRA
jgi:ATP-dependent helicase/nuclease subunit B